MSTCSQPTNGAGKPSTPPPYTWDPETASYASSSRNSCEPSKSEARGKDFRDFRGRVDEKKPFAGLLCRHCRGFQIAKRNKKIRHFQLFGKNQKNIQTVGICFVSQTKDFKLMAPGQSPVSHWLSTWYSFKCFSGGAPVLDKCPSSDPQGCQNGESHVWAGVHEEEDSEKNQMKS